MTPAPARVLVFGLGTFGGQIAVARFFARAGSRVTVTDKKPREKLQESVAGLEGLGVRFVLGEHREQDFLETDLVVRSPAVPPTHELVLKARAAGVRVTTEIELTLSRLRAPYAAVTGTKGKSTTTALLGAMLREQFGRVRIGGNIGRPLLEEAAEIGPDEKVVVELSSFMAEDLALARAAGERLPAPVLLAITSLAPEHLDRHGSKEAYYAAKLSLLDGMLREDALVYTASVGGDDLTREIEKRDRERLPARGGPVCIRPGASLSTCARLVDGKIVQGGTPLFPACDLALAGEHNLENAALAAVAARLLGAGPEAIARAVRSFRALPHRLETVATDREGRVFVNDSIATTPEAAVSGLRAFAPRGPVVLLLGGRSKGADLAFLEQEVATNAHAAVCLGETGSALAEGIARRVRACQEEGRAFGCKCRASSIPGSGHDPRVVLAPRFEDAFAIARELCPPGGVVLLSPAFSSYDMFRNFEERGESFARLARAACQGESASP
ncbi:UDP-N-acetylmuramoyl-L-alanine--D-glutamate ligase [bacterium]|nr:UDP-N-acetylmuramoyl-L-alanine--D-glutamate ligase [bacterium]